MAIRSPQSRRWSTGHSRAGIRRHSFLSGYDFYLGKSLIKRAQSVLAKTPVAVALKKAAPVYSKAIAVAAPVGGAIVGTLVGSPTAGAAAGTAAGIALSSATAPGGKAGKRRAAIRAGEIGLAVTGATGLLSATGAPSKSAPAMATDASTSSAGQEWDPVRGEYVQKSSGSTDYGWVGKAVSTGLTAAEKKIDKQSSAPAMPGQVWDPMTGTYVTASPSGSGGGGGPGGSGAGGTESKGGETQNLILLGGAALGLLFLLKR